MSRSFGFSKRRQVGDKRLRAWVISREEVDEFCDDYGIKDAEGLYAPPLQASVRNVRSVQAFPH
jgi:hypothetical protein